MKISMKKSSQKRSSSDTSMAGKSSFISQMKKYVNDDAVRMQIDKVLSERGKGKV